MNKLQNNVADISNNYYKYLTNLKNVNAIGYGYKYINNKNTFEPCIHILVESKINSNYLPSNNIIPKEYMGIKTDVIEIGSIILNNQEKEIIEFPDKVRPLTGGCSISIDNDNSSGTLCCIVSKYNNKNNKKDYFILSNNHVLAKRNIVPLGTSILQPAYPLGGSSPNDVIANLTTFVPIKFITKDVEPVNFVDCAIAQISNESMLSRYITDIGAIEGVDSADLDMYVQKFGHISGFSEGFVLSLHTTIPPNEKSGRNYIYQEQIVSKIKTLSGDSGTAIVNDDNKIIGMHMASAEVGFSFANNINKVLEELNVEIYTG